MTDKPKRDRAREIYRKWFRNGSRFNENDCIAMLHEMEQSTLRRAVEVDIKSPYAGDSAEDTRAFNNGWNEAVGAFRKAIHAILNRKLIEGESDEENI